MFLYGNNYFIYQLIDLLHATINLNKHFQSSRSEKATYVFLEGKISIL